MVCFPNAKINLGLYVTNKRDDGYHDLATVFLPVPLFDVLEIVQANNGITDLYLYGTAIAGSKEGNLVWKAWKIFESNYSEKVHPIHIHLKKGIPMGAGMGGGSSDGAFMLTLMNEYFELGLSENVLLEYALELGSDCPFFIKNKPQLAYGRGEILSDIDFDAAVWQNYKVYYLHPDVHISTKQAFEQILPQPANIDLSTIATLDIQQWKDKIYNVFEQSFFHYHPEYKTIKEQLYNMGAVYVSLTGTGSTIYAIFPKDFDTSLINTLSLHNCQWVDDVILK
jgi:4-diphosphocytidyl-2-C-methyl-D-erythritol kinase